MIQKTYIIAGNRIQYDMFIGKLPISEHPSDYQYVSTPDTVRGINDPHGLFIGTWHMRKDIVDIVINLMAASRSENPQLRKILKQVMPSGVSLSDLSVYLDGVILHHNQEGVHMVVHNGDTLLLSFEHPPLCTSEISVKTIRGTVMVYIANGVDTHFSIPVKGTI